MLFVLHSSLDACVGRWWASTWILPIVLVGRWKEREGEEEGKEERQRNKRRTIKIIMEDLRIDER